MPPHEVRVLDDSLQTTAAEVSVLVTEAHTSEAPQVEAGTLVTALEVSVQIAAALVSVLAE
jgi:hypothetical protein